MRKVMIIDDDPVVVYIMRKQFRDAIDFELTQEFSSAELALDYLERVCSYPTRLPDLILLDIRMPIIDGWRFLELIHEIDFAKKINIIILSVSASLRDLEKAKTFPMVSEYLLKPLNIQVLQEV